MAPQASADRFVAKLATRSRVLLLGGMAVIAHGLDRKTKDVDVWLDPMPDLEQWTACLASAVAEFPDARFWSLPGQAHVNSDGASADVEAFGVIRVTGFDRDVDVFRKPNELDVDDFERVWAASRPLEDGVHLPTETDLFMTKANTGREHDLQDQLFLESLVKKRFRERLPVCDAAEAHSLLDRFLDPEVLSFALRNPHAEVRESALQSLREFEAEGDPYSRDILAEWQREHA